MKFSLVVCRVEREILQPVLQVDSLETAYSHIRHLRRSWPGDYLIMEHDAAYSGTDDSLVG